MAQHLASDQIAKRNANLMEGKYLSFSMDQEEYGIGILTVKEIIGMMRITPVPQTPDYVKGVINLRGKVIAVIDLRLRFGMNSKAYTERTCIIVVEIDASKDPADRHRRRFGLGGPEHQGLGHRRDPGVRNHSEHRLYPWNGKNSRKCKNPARYCSSAERK